MILLTLLIVGGTTQASEWVSAAYSVDGKEQMFVDVSSIRIVGDTRHAWDKLVPRRHTMKGEGDSAKKFIAYEVGKVAYNCADETMKDDSLTVYYEDGIGETISSEALTKGWRPVPPDTLMSFEMQFICAWKPATK